MAEFLDASPLFFLLLLRDNGGLSQYALPPPAGRNSYCTEENWGGHEDTKGPTRPPQTPTEEPEPQTAEGLL